MDWEVAIERNRADLIRAVTWLFTWAKIDIGGSVETLPRFKRLTLLFVLRPSESALRRLILVMTIVRGMTAAPFKEGATRSCAAKSKSMPKGDQQRRPLPFKLIDPRKRFDLFPERPKYVKGPGPRVTDMWSDDPIFDRSDLYAYQNRPEPTPEDDLSAVRLCGRMNSVMAALDDLPAQALRMVNLQARIQRRFERTGKPNLAPMRPGAPPGYRRRHKHEIDEVLHECQQIALRAMREPPDTS